MQFASKADMVTKYAGIATTHSAANNAMNGAPSG